MSIELRPPIHESFSIRPKQWYLLVEEMVSQPVDMDLYQIIQQQLR